MSDFSNVRDLRSTQKERPDPQTKEEATYWFWAEAIEDSAPLIGILSQARFAHQRLDNDDQLFIANLLDLLFKIPEEFLKWERKRISAAS